MTLYNTTQAGATDSVHVDPNTDTDEALQQAQKENFAEIRSSSYRRRNIETYAQLLANQSIRATLKEDLPTAYIDQSRNPALMAITAREVEQPATDYDRDVYDYIMQYGFTVHECGHALFTDHDAKMKRVNQIEPHLQPAAHHLWNVFEDGAIEEAMRDEFSDKVTELLRVLNANLRGGENDYSQSIDDLPPHITDQLDDDELDELEDELEELNSGPKEVDFFNAVMTAAMDLTVWDSGQTNALITGQDPELLFASEEDQENFMDWLPRISETAATVLTTADPVRRTNVIFDFWEELEEFMKDEDMIPDADDLPDSPGGKPDDSDSQMGQGQPAPGLGDNDTEEMDQRMQEVMDGEGSSGSSPSPQQPDDPTSGNGAGDEHDDDQDIGTEDGDESGAGDDKHEDEDEVGGGGAGNDEEDGDEHDGASGDDDHDDDTADIDVDTDENENGKAPSEQEPSAPGGTPEENDALEQQARQKIQQEQEQSQGVDQQLKQEMEKMKDVMNGSRQSGNTPLEGVEFQLHRETGDDKDWSQAQRDGQSLASILMEKLRQEERQKTRRNQRRGSVDRSRLPALVTSGNTRVFKKNVPGGEKDYSCMVVLDRSGSMGGRDTQVAQRAVGAFMFALDKVGIDVSLMDMYKNKARVISPFGQNVKAAHGGIYSDESGGSTPLSDCLFAARTRLEQRGGNPFIIVITDGHPDDNQQYMEELRQCHMPVLGVLLNLGQDESSVPDWMEEQQQNYHRTKMVFNDNELQESLKELARSVMF